MNILLAVVCTFVAGIINGSFALPTKYIQQWNFENIWLNYSFWSFFIFPWLIIFIIDPHVGNFYLNIPGMQLLILIIGGILFGIGQVCFVQALKMIGFGLGFVINIGLGTGLGFLLPLIILHPSEILTPFGYVTLLGLFFIIAGLLLSYFAGKQRDAHHRKTQTVETSPTQYHFGVILAVIAGFCSACQNFTFAITHTLQQQALTNHINTLASSIIIWPIFLTLSFMVFALYMLYLHGKNSSFSNYQQPKTKIYILMTMIMALMWYSSLILYSVACLFIGNLGPIIAWPLFMVMIILTSNFWGWQHHEWANTTSTITNQALKAIGLLVIAVIILGFSATLSN